MSFNIQGVIQAMTVASETETKADDHRQRTPVITLSRDHGSGGDEIAASLAEQLGIGIYDEEILDAIAKHANVNPSLLQDLHEKVDRTSDAWLYSVVFGQSVSKDDYLRFLVTSVRSLYRMGGIIKGRGAHVILAGRDIFRVRIIGSVEACAKRIANQQQMDLNAAKKEVRETNRKRGRLIWRLFNSRLNDASNFDIVINTDHFADYNQVVDIIMQAMRSLGYQQTATEPAKQ